MSRAWQGRLTRRRLLIGAAGLGAGLRIGRVPFAAGSVARPDHQPGIATPPPAHLLFAAHDVVANGPTGLRELLRAWSAAADALGAANELSITFGLGPTLFDERFGLASRRPSALVHLPPFPGDRLDPARSGGDLAVQICAADASAARAALEAIGAAGAGGASERWTRGGFRSIDGMGMHRNLLGFKEGANNIRPTDGAVMTRFVWADKPDWMAGGTYLVARRIHMRLHKWSRETVAHQEQAIGREKLSGERVEPVPAHAHIRLAAASMNGGVRILRRGYSYDDGVKRTGERDAGLFFISFQRDPAQFVTLQNALATRQDTLRDYIVHTTGAVFACPPAPAPGGHVGDGLWA